MGLHCFLIAQKYSVGINDYDQQMYLKAAHWVVSYISVSKRKIEHALICSDILLKSHAYLKRRLGQFDFDTYRNSEQRRLRRVCAYAQTRQGPRRSHAQCMDVDEAQPKF